MKEVTLFQKQKSFVHSFWLIPNGTEVSTDLQRERQLLGAGVKEHSSQLSRANPAYT